MNRNTFDDIFDRGNPYKISDGSLIEIPHYINIESIANITSHVFPREENGLNHQIIITVDRYSFISRLLSKADHDLYLGKILYQVEQAQNNPCTYREKLVD